MHKVFSNLSNDGVFVMWSSRGYTAKLATMHLDQNKDAVYVEYKKGALEVHFVREGSPKQIRDLFMNAMKNPSEFLIRQTKLMVKKWYWPRDATVLLVSGQPFVPSKSSTSSAGSFPAMKKLDEITAGKVIVSIKTGALLPVSYLLS